MSAVMGYGRPVVVGDRVRLTRADGIRAGDVLQGSDSRGPWLGRVVSARVVGEDAVVEVEGRGVSHLPAALTVFILSSRDRGAIPWRPL